MSTDPSAIAAAIRYNPDAMPVLIGLFCDRCGTTEERDYLCHVDDDRETRFGYARKHLSEKEGWSCDEHGDFCPACVAQVAAVSRDGATR